MRCGVIANAQYNELDGWYYVDGIIWDEKAQELINKGWSVSCSYDFLAFNDEGGEENNIHYDKEFTQLNFTHLAIVDNPRYERANIVFNSKVNNEDKWITIHPNGEDGKGKHLLLKDGESPKEAIERTYGKGKQSDTKDEKKDKYIGKKFFIGDREDEITEYLPQFDRYMGKNPEGLNWGAQLYTKEDLEKFVKSDEEYLKEKELREKQKVEREQAQKQKEEEEKAVQAEYMRDNGFTKGMTDIQKGKTLKDLNKEVWYKQINDGKPTTSKKMIEELIGKGFKPKEETFRTTKKINGERIDKDTVSKILKDKDGNFYKLNSTEYKYAQYLQNKGKQSDLKGENKADNSKEIEMNIIDKLQELINSVKNNKENETMVENEKVDKRKLIDEVAGIMKSAGCDDEDIRTAIGKMEKIGYDDSEASADNKKVKNEADEEDKKEEDKKDDKKEDKVDNESEEDKEKAEDLKEEEKKDIDNKCKNSKEESYFDKLNKIYNSAKKIENTSVEYEDKQARLDAGKEYFG